MNIQDVKRNSWAVDRVLKSGGTLEDCVVALYEQNREMFNHILGLEAIAPPHPHRCWRLGVALPGSSYSYNRIFGSGLVGCRLRAMKCPRCSYEWTPDASEIAAEFGRRTSKAKARAARRNAKLGGWPKGKKRGKRKPDANQIAHGVV